MHSFRGEKSLHLEYSEKYFDANTLSSIFQLIKAIGNRNANDFWEYSLPPDKRINTDTSAPHRKAHIENKYKTKLYCDQISISDNQKALNEVILTYRTKVLCKEIGPRNTKKVEQRSTCIRWGNWTIQIVKSENSYIVNKIKQTRTSREVRQPKL
jgi:hypothetical protein